VRDDESSGHGAAVRAVRAEGSCDKRGGTSCASGADGAATSRRARLAGRLGPTGSTARGPSAHSVGAAPVARALSLGPVSVASGFTTWAPCAPPAPHSIAAPPGHGRRAMFRAHGVARVAMRAHVGVAPVRARGAAFAPRGRRPPLVASRAWPGHFSSVSRNCPRLRANRGQQTTPRPEAHGLAARYRPG